MLNRSITAEKTEEFAPADLQDLLDCTDSFVNRHIGPTETEIEKMLAVLGVATVEELIAQTVPSGIRLQKSLNLPPALSEYAALAQLKAIASKNQVFRSFIGMGYHDCITPPVILRNILEN
ncbi:MAG: glycine dehydrogenase (aminomethyl-transferring), partial [Microcystis sp. M49629_WE12]|nr:glycine dehydrogenase (aminomethyl-transferring) [Microcystis sp. M49629_WE12]